MLTESKITISCSVASINAALGVSGHELLKIYLLGLSSSGGVVTVENIQISKIKTNRKRNETITSKKGTEGTLDPRTHTTYRKTVDQVPDRYRIYSFHNIRKHKSKLVDWKDNEAWWKETYKTRKYMLENLEPENSLAIAGAYKNQTYLQSNDLHLNQFCDKSYTERAYYNQHKTIFWLMCTTDAKNPDEGEEAKIISQAKKAKFPKGDQEEEITYLTFKQAKKPETKNTNIKGKEDKFVVYDYSEKWWKWSYEYRLQIDKADETSAFPLSEKFKKVNKGWEETNYSDETNLNTACKKFYEQENSLTQDEIDDAWRYCTDTGKA
ncbi:hypothetical protein [Candidatus Mycoplasma haematohominis]|uniref:hypothetical protein n=1 Tax=Candidatus Mycoplasma haematohominis TaxID=1494318 RepID=UPI001C0A68B9|nr:hypothetical protein [Candidatus Mycoplasma haemohominis]